MSAPIDITDDTLASSLVPVQCASLAPPARSGSFASIITVDVTHTHAAAVHMQFECECVSATQRRIT